MLNVNELNQTIKKFLLIIESSELSIPLLKYLFKWCASLMFSFPDVLHRHDLEVEVIGGWWLLQRKKFGNAGRYYGRAAMHHGTWWHADWRRRFHTGINWLRLLAGRHGRQVSIVREVQLQIGSVFTLKHHALDVKLHAQKWYSVGTVFIKNISTNVPHWT